MKKLVFFASVVLCACNNPSAGPADQTPAKTDTLPAVREEKFPVAYYSASGDNPKWSLEMSMEQNGSYSVVLAGGHGADTLKGSFERSAPVVDGKPAVAANELLFNGVLEGALSGEASQIRIFGESCTSPAGKSYQTSCRIKSGKTQLQGCGSYID